MPNAAHHFTPMHPQIPQPTQELHAHIYHDPPLLPKRSAHKPQASPRKDPTGPHKKIVHNMAKQEHKTHQGAQKYHTTAGTGDTPPPLL